LGQRLLLDPHQHLVLHQLLDHPQGSEVLQHSVGVPHLGLLVQRLQHLVLQQMLLLSDQWLLLLLPHLGQWQAHHQPLDLVGVLLEVEDQLAHLQQGSSSAHGDNTSYIS